jgi:ribosomal protein S18 acetylase RimI-like enzyme
MDVRIRPARPDDAEGISRVVVAALRQTNAADYPAAVIDRVAQGFSPEMVRGLLARRIVFVATEDEAIVGTAGLEDAVVRTVFVSPGRQRRGLGRALMDAVGHAAAARGVAVLSVPSSLTAEGFYAALGFRRVGERVHGEERTVIMERRLRR